MFEAFNSQLYSTVVLVIVLYLIHRSFHKVNFFGFVMISAVLITISNYMTTVLHINQLIAMLTMILGYPLFSYLASSSVKGMKKRSGESPFIYPMLPPNYPGY